MHERRTNTSQSRGFDGSEKPANKRDHVKVTLKAVVRPGDPPYTALLTDPAVDNAVCGALCRLGWPRGDLPDGLQHVRWRVIRSFVVGGKKPPPTVGEMKALCARTARRCAISRLRKRRTAKKRGDVGFCDDPDKYVPLHLPHEQRDPVDTRRLLEVLAELFRQGRMPDHGVEIIEGIAEGLSYDEVAQDVGISSGSVQGRLKTMRKVFRQEIGRRRMTEKSTWDPRKK